MKETIYLVTGATGFLGMNIAKKLAAQNKKMKVLVLAGDPVINYLPDQAEIVLGDLIDKTSLEKFFTVPAHTEIVVIHCASIVSLSPDFSQKVYDINVTGTENIVDFCVAKKVKKLIYISSTGAIAEAPGNQIIQEPAMFLPDQVVGYYAKTKALATQYVLKMVQEKNLDASVIYPSGICGPNDYAYGPVAEFIIRYCQGKMTVGIEGTFNSVDVRDLADGVISCVKNGRKGEGYIMSNELVTMRRMFDLISQASGAKRIETILTKEQMLQMQEKGSHSSETEKNQKVLEFEIYNLTRNNNFSSEKAIKELSYHTRPFEETMVDSVEWLRSVGKVKR
ncbi:NAD-dependent epimerase/dehydratase family protein [Anaerosinus massiliensis]|uniref:NAD-dependent epimerase/dehydratase family protein n=1 Tax=Massilibacillus massiliensis TaxID=1806837 RepID=UPI000A5F1510|nr:NAD-dependent epimerase/dehydratase family protein [Massilibacillus massiliensis]